MKSLKRFHKKGKKEKDGGVLSIVIILKQGCFSGTGSVSESTVTLLKSDSIHIVGGLLRLIRSSDGVLFYVIMYNDNNTNNYEEMCMVVC